MSTASPGYVAPPDLLLAAFPGLELDDKVCDCMACQRLLLGPSSAGRRSDREPYADTAALPAVFYTRVGDRFICRPCARRAS